MAANVVKLGLSLSILVILRLLVDLVTCADDADSAETMFLKNKQFVKKTITYTYTNIYNSVKKIATKFFLRLFLLLIDQI